MTEMPNVERAELDDSEVDALFEKRPDPAAREGLVIDTHDAERGWRSGAEHAA